MIIKELRKFPKKNIESDEILITTDVRGLGT